MCNSFCSLQCCGQVHPFWVKDQVQDLSKQDQDQDRVPSIRVQLQLLSILVWVQVQVLNFKCLSSKFYFLNMTKIANSQEIFVFHNMGHIFCSPDGLVPNPWVIKAQNRAQNQVIDIWVQDQDQDQDWAKLVLRLVWRLRPISRPQTLVVYCCHLHQVVYTIGIVSPIVKRVSAKQRLSNSA